MGVVKTPLLYSYIIRNVNKKDMKVEIKNCWWDLSNENEIKFLSNDIEFIMDLKSLNEIREHFIEKYNKDLIDFNLTE